MTSGTGSPTNWFAANGDQVSIGDTVATYIGPGVHGRIVDVSSLGLPVVRLTAGARAGEDLVLWPGQILSRFTRE